MVTADLSVRGQILETADRLFYEQGYNLTGINQIIEEAGVAKASLYYHFPSKEDLCVAYLQKRYQNWSARLSQFLKGVEDPGERILQCFECRSQFLLETNFGGCSYIRIIAEMPQRTEKINHQVIINKEKQRQFFKTQVNNLSGIKPGHASDLAQTIFLLFDGATMQSQVYRSIAPMKQALKAVKALF